MQCLLITSEGLVNNVLAPANPSEVQAKRQNLWRASFLFKVDNDVTKKATCLRFNSRVMRGIHFLIFTVLTDINRYFI